MVGSWVVSYGGNTRFGWMVGVWVYGLLQYLRGRVFGDGVMMRLGWMVAWLDGAGLVVSRVRLGGFT